MKNIFKLFGIIALAAVIGFLAACSNGDDTPPSPVHNHVWGDWTVTKVATCIAKGEETRVCTLDATHKETREIAIDSEAHDWELLEGTAPTCTTDGNGKEKCKLCGIEESGVLPALGHDWGEWVQTKAPTETEDGEEIRICKYDTMHKEINAIAALNHTHVWGEWSVTTPTICTAKGERIRLCTLNPMHKNIEDIAELGHDWEWLVTTPATYTTEGLETKTCKHDPSHTDGTRPISRIPFTSIADFATWLSDQPNNTVSTPYLIKLNVSNLGGRSTEAGSAGKMLTDNSTKYVSLDLSNSTITSIEVMTFSSCTSLTSVTIPNSVTSISLRAFSGCTSLSSITIPASVTSIAGGVFSGCTSLTGINVDDNNLNFVVNDGILYNKEKTQIISIPQGISGFVTIPTGVLSIGSSAFRNCTGLTGIAIPQGITTIDWYVFENCTSLTSVTLPINLTTIGGNAFSNCTSLTDIIIPKSVNSVGNDAFQNWDASQSITIGYCSQAAADTAWGISWRSNCSAVLNYGDMHYWQWVSTATATDNGTETKVCGCGKIDETSTRFSYAVGNLTNDYFELISTTSWRVKRGDTEPPAVVHIPAYRLNTVTDTYLPVTEIGWTNSGTYSGTFYGRSNIIAVHIPDTVTAINGSAFDSCSITSVIIPASVTSIDRFAFMYSGLTSITFLGGVTIHDRAFSYCAALDNITISPVGVTVIGSQAFLNCTNLSNVTILDGETYIGGQAFETCTNLKNITLPANVTVAPLGFYQWNNEQTIYIKGFTSQEETDAAWPKDEQYGYTWRSYCNAQIIYLGQ